MVVRHMDDRLTRLARVTAELATAHSLEAVTKIVTSHAADAVGAAIASLTLLEDDDQVRLLGRRGGREGDAQRWATFSLDTGTPASDAIRTGERVMCAGQDRIAARYPQLDVTA